MECFKKTDRYIIDEHNENYLVTFFDKNGYVIQEVFENIIQAEIFAEKLLMNRI